MTCHPNDEDPAAINLRLFRKIEIARGSTELLDRYSQLRSIRQ